jgi:site-specific DNA-cytosine methylase
LNVLSLFDGISCGQVALERAGIVGIHYYASEIDREAIQVTTANYPNTIQLGDVCGVRSEDLPKIDLLIGGSPCQGFSVAGYMQGFDDPRSALFFEYARLLRETNPRWFLLENVVIGTTDRQVISDMLGVEPVLIDSALVSSQYRKRLYWTNIPFTMPEDRGITIQDIIYDDTYHVINDPRILPNLKITDKRVSWDLSGSGQSNQEEQARHKHTKMTTVVKMHPLYKNYIWLGDGLYRRCHPVEFERFQTLPDHYTAVIKSDRVRAALIGNGWTVEVIAHILRGIKDVS